MLPAFAGTNNWTTNKAGYGPFNSFGEVVAGVPAEYDPGNPGCAPHVVAGTNTSDTTSPYSWTIDIDRDGCVNVTLTATFTNSCATISKVWNATYAGCAEICVAGETLNTTTGMCESPTFDCGTVLGETVNRFYSEPAGGAICTRPPGGESGDECVATPVGLAPVCVGGECFATLSYTGGFCSAEPDVPEVLVDEPGDTNCISGDGVTVCMREDSQNCGTVNGQAICLESVPAGNCAFLGNGGMVCSSSATGGPTESDGVTPATPDGTFSAASEDNPGDTFNYYGPGTLADSGTTVTGGSMSGATDEGTSEGACEEVGSCPGTLPELGETETFGDSTYAYFNALFDVPIVVAVEEMVTAFPEGECPAPTATIAALGDVELTLDAHCTLWPEWAPVLATVLLAFATFLAARIILSA